MIKVTNWLLVILFLAIQMVSAQDTMPPPRPMPKPTVSPASTSSLEYVKQTSEITQEKRQEAYAKLFEGQRHIWSLSKSRTDAEIIAKVKSAKDAIQKSVELNPTLAEGYTALAELTYQLPPNDYDEAIRLANIAIKINPDNYGAHQILARLFTLKSRLNQGIIDPANAEKAINQWKQVTRLDARNAEANAFLSEFYDKTGQPKESIASLKQWLSSSTPIDSRFYSRITGESDLSPESALVKLGAKLLKEGENREAVEILSRAVADNPKDEEAIELLSRAIETADDKTSVIAIDSLQQATFANPENVALITLLAQIQSRAGKIDEAAKILGDSAAKLKAKNKVGAANLQIALGDIYIESNRFDEAVRIYKNALPLLGIENKEIVSETEKTYVAYIYDKIIQTYKNAERPADVKKSIEEAGLLLGNEDLYANKKLVGFYRENGQKDEALKAVRNIRTKLPQDYEFLLLEAEILTDNGKVDEGVALLKALIGKNQPENNINTTYLYDDFSNYLYISNFYSQANRGKEAVEAANQALTIAKSVDRKQRAKLSLATAYQTSGDFRSAELQLREILSQNPENSIALNNLGYFLLERNEKLNEAFELIQKAVSKDSTNPSFLDSLGWAYFKLNKFDEAERYLKTALKYSESATILEHLGDVYQKQGKSDLAKTNWQKALKISNETEQTNRIKTKLGEKITK